MLVHIPRVLTADELSRCRTLLEGGAWTDGRITAGHQSARAKRNRQLPDDDPAAREAGAVVLAALERHALMMAAALPRHIFTPLFNCYRTGDGFGNHVDNAIRYDRGYRDDDRRPHPIRTDLSATLFISAPEEYDGGELAIEEHSDTRRVKLAAGDLILYPATSVHRVEPVTRGSRLACFFWIQSLVRDATQRGILLDLDTAIQKLERDHADHPAAIELVGTYHNLLRLWADT